MNWLKSFFPVRSQGGRLVCIFEYPVTIRYEYTAEVASMLGHDQVGPSSGHEPAAPRPTEVRSHRINWHRPTFARDDIEQDDHKLLPFIKDIIVAPVERQYYPAELVQVALRGDRLVVMHVGGKPVGYFGGIAYSIEQACRWVATGAGLKREAWQVAP